MVLPDLSDKAQICTIQYSGHSPHVAIEHLKCVLFKLTGPGTPRTRKHGPCPQGAHSKRVGRRVRINRHANKQNAVTLVLTHVHLTVVPQGRDRYLSLEEGNQGRFLVGGTLDG